MDRRCILLSVVLSLTACTSGSEAEPNTGATSETGAAPWRVIEVDDGASGIITTGTGLGWGASEDDEWEPTIDEIDRFESLLPAALANDSDGNLERPTSAYTRWYSGLVIDGVRQLYVWFACNTPATGEALEQIRFVDGGGDCFFEARYEPAAMEITRISVNGPDCARLELFEH